jgi:hypothetical protein
VASGWDNKLTELLGNYLVAAKLTRNGLLVSFAPTNAQHVDLLATNKSLKTVPLQLKTIRRGTWQIDARNFLEISFTPVGKNASRFRQTITGKHELANPDMPYVFVRLGAGPEGDEFYVCLAKRVQRIITQKYSDWLELHDGVRPKNSKSTHCGLRNDDLQPFRDNWDSILKHSILQG